MARAPESKAMWTEEALGLLVLCVLGWYFARAYQANGGSFFVPQQVTPIPQSNTSQAQGTQYFWPGPYTGSPIVGLSPASTVPQLEGLTIPPVSAVQLPPVTTSSMGGQVGQSCCNSCYSGAGN